MTVTLKLKDDVDALRIRETPVDGKPVGQLYPEDRVTCDEALDAIKRKLGVEGEWLKIRTAAGVEAYTAAWLLVAEGELPAEEPLLLTPKEDGLRLREAPVSGNPVGQVNNGDVLVTLEDNATTRGKLAAADEWLHVRTADGREVYTAAWFLQEYAGPAPVKYAKPAKDKDKSSEKASGAADTPTKAEPVQLGDLQLRNITGMNLDVRHPLGAPDPARLAGLGWVRFGYDVSMEKGSEDIDVAYNAYRPVIERYAAAGFKVLLCFTHETYGEGKNEYWPWPEMTTDKWRHLTERFTEMVGRIVRQYAGQNLVHAYQVWNEMDAPIGAAASVPMLPNDYAIVLSQTIKTIKAIDPQAFVITGGHTGGPGNGANYARETLRHCDVMPDGIAFHPYGRGITNPAPPYTIFGHIDDSMKQYTSILPNKPVWITEWGVLDRPHDNPADILGYARDVVGHIKTNWSDKIASMMWYAWAMGMHNGYGLVAGDDQPLQPLNDGFRQL